MANLSDFKRGPIGGARMRGACVTKTGELFGEAMSTVSKGMTAYGQDGKTSSLKQNSGRKQKLSHRDRWSITQIIWKDQKTIAPKITSEFNEHLETLVSSNT